MTVEELIAALSSETGRGRKCLVYDPDSDRFFSIGDVRSDREDGDVHIALMEH